MSLVGDALRKARSETLGTGPLGPRTPLPPPPSRLGAAVALALVAGGLVAVAGGGAVWWALSGARTPAAANAAATTTGPADASPHLPAATPQPANAPVPSTSAPNPGPASARSEAPTIGPASASAGERSAADDPAPVTTNAARPSTRKRVRDQVYVLTADLGGGVVLELEYLVVGAADRWAVVNGRELRLGDSIEGFEVTAIEARQVTLTDAHGPLTLRTR